MARSSLSGAISATDTAITLANNDENPQFPSGWLYVEGEPMLYTAVADRMFTVLRGLAIGTVGRDLFDRDVPEGGWGLSVIGDDWTGANAGQLVTDGVGGIMRHTIADSDDTLYLSAARHHNVEVHARVRWSQSAAGDALRWAFRVRRQGDGASQTWYELRVIWDPASGLVELHARKNQAGSISSVVSQAASSVDEDTALVNVRFRVTGTSAVRVQARVWSEDDTEPDTWLLDGTDATPSALIGGWGYLGLETRVAAAYSGTLPLDAEMSYLQVNEVAEPVAHANGAPVAFIDRATAGGPINNPALAHGDMLYMGPDGIIHRIPAPEAATATLQWLAGRPQWV